ncbi:hypothetical protein IKN40_05610 [bacterium]|nr:hypothetical protein [bacterium]
MNETEVLGFNPQDLFNNSDENNSSNQGNSLIYKTRPQDSVSEDGHYRAKIKIIYNPENPKKSFLEQQSYGMQDTNGFFTVISSLTIEDKTCPIFTAWKKCHYAEAGTALYNQALSKDKGGKQLFDKRFARYVIVQILKDKNQPDLEGSFKLWKLPTSIYNLLQQKMNPAKESGKMSIPVMDYLFGRAINIDVAPGPDDKANPQRKTREITYTGEFTEDIVSCVNPDKSPLLNDEEQEILDNYIAKIEKAWKMTCEDEEDFEKRNKIIAAANSSDEYKKLLPIYGKVLAQIKEWAPKLDMLSYKPWSDEVKKRVDNWIKIVLSGNDPATYKPEIEEALEANTETKFETETKVETPNVDTEVDETSDLPF